MLGADVVVVEHPGLFLGQDDNPPRSVGEPLKHRAPRPPRRTASQHQRCAAYAHTTVSPPRAASLLVNATARALSITAGLPRGGRAWPGLGAAPHPTRVGHEVVGFERADRSAGSQVASAAVAFAEPDRSSSTLSTSRKQIVQLPSRWPRVSSHRHDSPPTALFHNADIAMYRTKSSRTGTAIAYRMDHAIHVHRVDHIDTSATALNTAVTLGRAITLLSPGLPTGRGPSAAGSPARPGRGAWYGRPLGCHYAWYNPRRIQAGLGGLSPDEYEETYHRAERDHHRLPGLRQSGGRSRPGATSAHPRQTGQARPPRGRINHPQDPQATANTSGPRSGPPTRPGDGSCARRNRPCWPWTSSTSTARSP